MFRGMMHNVTDGLHQLAVHLLDTEGVPGKIGYKNTISYIIVLDMCIDMCIDVCMDDCIDLCTDLCTDMCIDMLQACVRTYVQVCVQTCALLP